MNKHGDDNVFGMDIEFKQKWQSKFSPEKMQAAHMWMQEVLGEEFDGADDSELHASLKDGIRLCKLVRKINKKYCKKPSKSSQAFVQRENICNYLDGCVALGMKKTDNFVTNDLFDNNNMVIVIDQITRLGGIAQTIPEFAEKGFSKLGVPYSTENVREFTEEQINEGKKAVPMTSQGSIAVEKSKGTDKIIMYGKTGQEMGKSVGGVSQQNSGSIAVEKSKGTDSIVMYGKVGQEMGKSTGGTSQQNSGSIAVEKEKGTDSIVMYGKTGQEMGKSHGGVSQQNSGSIAVEKSKGTDSIVSYGKVGQEMGESVDKGAVSAQNTGSLQTSKDKKLDSISRALN